MAGLRSTEDVSLDGITRICFGASYTIALGLDLAQLIRPSRLARSTSLLFGAAGLIAHTLFLAIQRPTLQTQYGSLLFLAWVLAVFYLYGALHHRRIAWATFVLPLVLGLVVLAGRFAPQPNEPSPRVEEFSSLAGERFWGTMHGTLILLAAVGVSVGFLASVMYLVQLRRLRDKVAPNSGFRLLSLERLETMNRRAVNFAFPLLTVGLLIGGALMYHRSGQAQAWTTGRVIGTAGLWLAFIVLLALRYGLHTRGRHLAVGTIAAFAVLIATLVTTHPFLEVAP